MHIKDVTVVFICPDHNDVYTKRKEHMFNLLEGMGVKTFVHYKSGSDQYPICLSKAVIDILEKYIDGPVLILEDDVEFTGITEFDFVDDADAIYLGLSACAGHPTENIDMGQSQFLPYTEQQVRIENMLAMHAILYISNRYKQAVIETLSRNLVDRLQSDVLISRIQRHYKILANKKPLFYQSAKFNVSSHAQDATDIIINDVMHILPREN